MVSNILTMLLPLVLAHVYIVGLIGCIWYAKKELDYHQENEG